MRSLCEGPCEIIFRTRQWKNAWSYFSRLFFHIFFAKAFVKSLRRSLCEGPCEIIFRTRQWKNAWFYFSRSFFNIFFAKDTSWSWILFFNVPFKDHWLEHIFQNGKKDLARSRNSVPGMMTSSNGNIWSPVNSPHKGQRRGALMFSLICAWINGWVNNR